MTDSSWETRANRLADELEAAPLLGPSRAAAERHADALADILMEHQHEALIGRLDCWRGAWLCASKQADAQKSLQTLMDAAAERQDLPTLCRLALYFVRSQARAGDLDEAWEFLSGMLQTAAEQPGLGLDIDLASASCGHPDARNLFEQCIKRLPSPQSDHVRLEVHLQLAALHHDGGDMERAEVQVGRALEIAKRHEDTSWTSTISATLGTLLVERGRPEAACSALQAAFDTAQELGDSLMVVTVGTVLAAIHLRSHRFTEAMSVSDGFIAAAASRGNWIGVADGQMNRAACLHHTGEVDASIKLLVHAGLQLQEIGAPAAVNLIKARLGELRSEMEPERFDPIFDTALQHALSPQPTHNN